MNNIIVLVQNPTRDQVREQVRAEVREQIEKAREMVQQARQEAQQAAQASQAAGQAAGQAAQQAAQAEQQAQIHKSVQDAIREVEKANADLLKETETSVGVPPPPGPPDIVFTPGIPPEAVTMTIAMLVALTTTIIGWPISRAIARRMDRKSVAATAPHDLNLRLERIENAVEAIAIEVERVSEGQRYSNNVMAELRALPRPNPMDAKQVEDLQRAGMRERVR
jgi:hypothetical protein